MNTVNKVQVDPANTPTPINPSVRRAWNYPNLMARDWFEQEESWGKGPKEPVKPMTTSWAVSILIISVVLYTLFVVMT